MLVRLNLISEEVEIIRHRLIMKRALVMYCVIWGVALLTLWMSYSNKRDLMQVQAREIKSLEKKIDEVVPEFYRSVKLFQECRKHQSVLSGVYKNAVESGFILQGLEGLSSMFPQNFWTDEIRLMSMENKKFDDTLKGKTEEVKVFEIKGKLFFETGEKRENQVEEFVSLVQKKQPFVSAVSKIDLNNMKVEKTNTHYFHNFTVQFAWMEPYFF